MIKRITILYQELPILNDGLPSITFVTIALLSTSCSHTGQKENRVWSRSYSIEEMKESAEEFGMYASDIESASEVGIFMPLHRACTREIVAYPPQDFGWFNPLTDLSQPPVNAIKATLSSFFMVFSDPNIVQHEIHDYNSIPLEDVIDSIVGGIWAPQCQGISTTAARIINTYSQEIESHVLETTYLDHALNVLYFKEDEKQYVIVADFQNGFLFPVQPVSGEFLSLNDLKEVELDDISFFWLPENVQHKKRNLLFSVLPCNLLPDEKERYHEAPLGSPYLLERLSFSFHKHLWFDLGTADVDSLKLELLETIVEYGQSGISSANTDPTTETMDELSRTNNY